MKRLSQCFGQLLSADLPQERVLSALLVVLALTYVGLSWTDHAPACADPGPLSIGLQSPIQSVSCQ